MGAFRNRVFLVLKRKRESKQSWVHAVHQISMVWFHSRSTICLIEHRPKHFDASSSDTVKSAMPTCHEIATPEIHVVSVLSVSLINAMRPMPSRAWMAMSSMGVISALTMHATSDQTLCHVAGTEAAVVADHDQDLEADDHVPDQVVADQDEAAPDHQLTKSPVHDPDPGQSRALDQDQIEDDTLFILLSHKHTFTVICQLIRKYISFLRV